MSSKICFRPFSPRVLYGLLAIGLVCTMNVRTGGAEPAPEVIDLDSNEVEVKGFISDLDPVRLSNEGAPSLELPPAVQSAPQVETAATEAKAAGSQPAAPERAAAAPKDELSRRDSPPAAKPASRASATGSGSAKAPASSSAPKKETAAKPAPREAGKTSTAKPAESTPKSVASAPRANASPAKAEKRPDTSKVLSRGDLTVTLGDGKVAAVSPSTKRTPVGELRPASRVSQRVEGKVAKVVKRADGRASVMVVTDEKEMVQVVAPGKKVRKLGPGAHIRVQGERIGGSPRYPVVEWNDFGPGMPPPHGPDFGPEPHFGGPPHPGFMGPSPGW